MISLPCTVLCPLQPQNHDFIIFPPSPLVQGQKIISHNCEVAEDIIKSSAVTIALDKGAPITDVQIYGRWLSGRTPLA